MPFWWLKGYILPLLAAELPIDENGPTLLGTPLVNMLQNLYAAC